MKYPIYLDHNASTPIHPKVFEAMRPYLEEHFGNPSCNHPYGWDAKEAVESSRQKVADLLGCDKGEVIFTSGGTEANNLAIFGIIHGRKDRSGIVTSTIEHPAVNMPLEYLERAGKKIQKVPVDSDGVLDVAAFQSAIDQTTALVTVMHANNETGSIQPIRAIADAAHALGITVHTDAAQSVGKVATRVDDLGVDLLSIAGHKLYAPKGVGALYIRNGVDLNPLLLGAGHEKGLRPGTENVASIVALGEACSILDASLEQEKSRVTALRDDLFSRLKEAIPGLHLNGHPTCRLPNTANVSFPGVRSNTLLPRADAIAASTGAACHEGGEEVPSYVLTAMGLSNDIALGAIRISLGRSTTPNDIESAADSLIKAYATLAR